MRERKKHLTPKRLSRRELLAAIPLLSYVPAMDGQSPEWGSQPAAAVASKIPPALVGPVRFQFPRLGPPWPKVRHPEWIRKGIVSVGNWEPHPWEIRKNFQDWGFARTGSESLELHQADRSEETVERLRKMSVNMVLTSFHKGFGIVNEKDTMEEARQFGERLHKHGMKMAVLVSTLLIYEDLYGEIPESTSWNRVLFDGTPDTYADDGYRYRAYLNHPAFMNYMKRVCELAVRNGVDAIFFDTVRQPAENHHPLAQHMFREWLKLKYPTQQAWWERTGLHYRDFVKVPHYGETARAAEFYENPIIQEYIDFKCQQITDFAAEMGAFIHKLHPETAIWFNTGGVTKGNVIYSFNMDHARLLPWLDLYYTEEPDYATYNTRGGIVSKIRAIKVGQRFGTVHINSAGQAPPKGSRSLDIISDDPRLRLAEAMAFNRTALGNMGYGAARVAADFPEAGRRYIKFFWDHFDLLAGSETAADVAVVRTFASLGFNNGDPQTETVLAEQALIQSQMPFDILFDHDFGNLSKYKVLMLGDQESLSNDQVSALKEYVRQGGGLVATADTSRFDSWRRQRKSFGLADVFGLERPRAAGGEERIEHEYANGRAVYFRHLLEVENPGAGINAWAPPKNAKALLSGIHWAARNRLNWHIEAPPYVAAEACYQAATGRHVVHLVNYDCWKHTTVERLKIAFRVGNGEIRKAAVYSPDEEKTTEIHVESSTDGGSLILPRFAVYAIVVLS